MIRVNDDYIIDIDPHNYIPKRDLHREKVSIDKNGEEIRVPQFDTVGYFGDLAGAVRGIIRDINRRDLDTGTHDLEEAIKIVRSNNDTFYDLLDRALKED